MERLPPPSNKPPVDVVTDGDRDHEAAVQFLFGRLNYERTPTVPYQEKDFKLERMVELTDRLGHPQHHLRIVHVAGSKGKGSTATCIASILKAAGYKVGLYTSPHVTVPEERISIGLQPCSASEFAQLILQIRPQVLAMDQTHPNVRGPTYFEVLTAAGLLHFHQQQVDVAVLEVGLGGRLDSTNICLPACSVITTISRDHTPQLGNTLPKIAFEKAGIIKPGIPVVCGVADQEPQRVIHRRATELGCAVYQLDRDFRFVITDTSPSPALFRYEELPAAAPRAVTLDKLSTGLLGQHQIANACVAIKSVRVLEQTGLTANEKAIRTGLTNVRCAARIEVVSRDPLIVIDAAHNEASMRALVDTLNQLWPGSRKTFLLAATRGKDVSGMLRCLLPHCDRLILTRYVDNPRCCEPQQVAQLVRQLTDELGGAPVDVAINESPASALSQALNRMQPDHLLCITGSFFLASELRPQLVQGPPQPAEPRQPLSPSE